MPVLTRPGVYVDESAFPTYVAATPGQAAAAFVGVASRGPLMSPTLVTSWRDFTRQFGGFEVGKPPSPMHLAVYSYFSAGGTSAVIVRSTVAAAVPTEASVTLDDQGTPTPEPTLVISAANEGAWGNSLSVSITPGSLSSTPDVTNPQGVTQTFNIIVYYQGTSPSNVVETWQNQVMPIIVNGVVQNPGANALDIVNSSFSGSNFIQLAQPSTPSASPSPTNNPAYIATQALAGGMDPASAAQPSDYLNAATLLDQYPDQPFVLNLCGVYDPGVTGLVVKQYAEPRGNIFVVLDPPPGNTPDVMTTWALSLTFRSDIAAVYYPQLLIANPYSSQVGQTLTVPPGGFITGQYISTDIQRGVAKAPAGLGTSLGGVYGVETSGILSNTQQGTLNDANVNCLIPVPGYGVVIWGARTLSSALVTRYVPVSRSLIYLSTEFVALTKFAVFEPNDWVLWNQISSVMTQFLTGFWQSGGLQGQSASDAFYVLCDSSINTVQSIQSGVVNVEVGVALQYPAEFVVIAIGQWAGGQSVTTTS